MFEKRKQKIRPNSVADRMMEVIITAGEIKRYKIRYFFSNISNNGYYKAYNKLLADNFIKEDKHTWKGYGKTDGKSTYVSATLAGRTQYANIYGQDYIKNISPDISQKLKFDRQSKAMDVNAMLSLCDMAYLATEKPGIESFLNLQCGEEYAKMAIQHGIAYSSKEIKEYLKEQHFDMGTNIPYDSASGSRFFTMLFYRRRVYILYNTGTKAMLWSSVTEHRLKTVLCKLINDSQLRINDLIPHQNDAGLCCVLVCSRKIGLANVMAGKGYRAIGRGADKHRKSLTIPIVVKDYPLAALVPMAGNKKQQFLNALNMQDKSVRDEYVDKITSLYPGLVPGASAKGITFVDGDGAIYCALPYIDLAWLMAYKGKNEPVYLIVPKTTQESISRFMGPLARGFFDANTMIPLYARRYNKQGQVIIPTAQTENNKST